jgi:hypothetical protein
VSTAPSVGPLLPGMYSSWVPTQDDTVGQDVVGFVEVVEVTGREPDESVGLAVAAGPQVDQFGRVAGWGWRSFGEQSVVVDLERSGWGVDQPDPPPVGGVQFTPSDLDAVRATVIVSSAPHSSGVAAATCTAKRAGEATRVCSEAVTVRFTAPLCRNRPTRERTTNTWRPAGIADRHLAHFGPARCSPVGSLWVGCGMAEKA